VNDAKASFADRAELHFLRARFSSGATLAELSSIATVISAMAGIQRPSRDTKRNINLLLKWFIDRWTCVYPWLTLISLRDVRGNVVDGAREKKDRESLG
jgi:hypothetical protein